VDVLVEFDPEAPIGLIEHFGLQEELSRLLGREVDLISKRGLNPLIRRSVLDCALVLYAA
jgi:predicted nucleotidyltransferase